MYRANAPVLVEVVRNTDWWQPYVPPLVGLIGSLIVATAAFVGVVKSNRTNRAAIDAADTRERDKWKADSDREREKWHRDNLLRICSDAVRASRDISRSYAEAVSVSQTLSNPEDFDTEFWKHMGTAQEAIDRIAPLSYDLMLLGETGLYVELQEVRQVGEFVGPAFVQYHRHLVANHPRWQATPTESILMAEALKAELHESREWRRCYKAQQHLIATGNDFQFAARRAISPDSVPKDTPHRVGPVITPEKNPDLFYPPPGSSQNPYRRVSSFDWNAGDTADSEPEPS